MPWPTTASICRRARRARARPDREYGQPGWEAGALRLLGEVASRRRPAEMAVADGDYRAALMAAESLGMRPLAARCHLGLAELLARATTMLRELGMHAWLEKATATLTR